jgi:hypothetical protein
MPNNIQNWDMAYAMHFDTINKKLKADFKENKDTKEGIITKIGTVTCDTTKEPKLNAMLALQTALVTAKSVHRV